MGKKERDELLERYKRLKRISWNASVKQTREYAKKEARRLNLERQKDYLREKAGILSRESKQAAKTGLKYGEKGVNTFASASERVAALLSKYGKKRLSNRNVLRENRQATIVLNQPVYTEDEQRFFNSRSQITIAGDNNEILQSDRSQLFVDEYRKEKRKLKQNILDW